LDKQDPETKDANVVEFPLEVAGCSQAKFNYVVCALNGCSEFFFLTSPDFFSACPC
jgi:hypothetical protein